MRKRWSKFTFEKIIQSSANKSKGRGALHFPNIIRRAYPQSSGERINE